VKLNDRKLWKILKSKSESQLTLIVKTKNIMYYVFAQKTEYIHLIDRFNKKEDFPAGVSISGKHDSVIGWLHAFLPPRAVLQWPARILNSTYFFQVFSPKH